MLDSKVILQKRVLSKLSNRSPVVFNAFLESVSPRVDSNLTDIDKILDTVSKNNKDYYNLMYSFKVRKSEDGKTLYNKSGSGLIPADLEPRKFTFMMKEIENKKDEIRSEIIKLKNKMNNPETSSSDKENISSDIKSFEKRLKDIQAKQLEVSKERSSVSDRIKDEVKATKTSKASIITKAANKLPKVFKADNEIKISKRTFAGVSESAIGMINDVNESFRKNIIGLEEKNSIIRAINESVKELDRLSSYDMYGFPSVEYSNNRSSYSDIYEREIKESSQIIDDAMCEYLSESALNSYEFILNKSDRFYNLPEVVSTYKEKCDCKNDIAVAIAVLALESAFCEDISTSDCGEIFGVLESVAFSEFSVGNMLPQMGSTEGFGTKLAETPIEDVVKATNVKIDENEEKVIEEAVNIAPKNNVIFDRETRAIYQKILKYTNISKENEEAQFQKSLNFKKNKYILKIENSEDPEVVSGVIAAIKGSGFTEYKEKGIVINYKKLIKNVDITVEFNKGDDSIVIFYELKNESVNESVEEIDLYQEAVLNTGRYIDLFKSYNDVMNMLYVESEDIKRIAKCKVLFERVDDLHDKINEYEKNVIANSQLFHGSYGVVESSLIDKCNGIYDEICEHPYMESISNNFDVLYESDRDIDDDIKSILTKLHRKGYVTLYSCSGHNGTRRKEDMYRDGVYKGKLYTTARVTFNKIHNFSNIPNGWYSSEKDGKTTLYVKPITYDEKQGSPNEAFAKWKSVYLENLRTWAKSVQEVTTDVKESDSNLYPMSELLDQFLSELF